MTQSTCQEHQPAAGLHVAVIMDGNGRWARLRRLRRSTGHRAGASAVRRVVEAAPALGIRTLTLYAFSSDNWKRPPQEVTALLRLLMAYLRTETATCLERGVRINVIGRRDRLPLLLRTAIEDAEAATAHGGTLQLRIALDYSARDAIVQAAARARGEKRLSRAKFAQLLSAAVHGDGAVPDVDLLIRTGGEQRLSDFLLWECAYAELYFTPCLWPDFTRDDLVAAMRDFQQRQRRFGGVEEVRTVALSLTS